MRNAQLFSRLSPAHIALTFEAAMRLLCARVLLQSLTFSKSPVANLPEAVTDKQLARARLIARSVTAASNRSPIALTCVHKSLALWWMLRARGIPGELRIGVLRQAEPFSAHAWVQFAGHALNEMPDVVDGYAAFAEAVLPHRRALQQS